MEEYCIRKLEKSDYEEYLELINNFRATQFTLEMFLNILDKIYENSVIWVIEYDNKLVATGTILYEYKFIHNICKLAHIEDICVHEKYRGKKFGQILVAHLMQESKREKCYKTTLYCAENLEKFYGLSGLEKTGIQMSMRN
jgi:glucosamine-phosphate N-acetyltransferase